MSEENDSLMRTWSDSGYEILALVQEQDGNGHEEYADEDEGKLDGYDCCGEAFDSEMQRSLSELVMEHLCCKVMENALGLQFPKRMQNGRAWD